MTTNPSFGALVAVQRTRGGAWCHLAVIIVVVIVIVLGGGSPHVFRLDHCLRPLCLALQ